MQFHELCGMLNVNLEHNDAFVSEKGKRTTASIESCDRHLRKLYQTFKVKEQTKAFRLNVKCINENRVM